jgi:hypothetical protein
MDKPRNTLTYQVPIKVTASTDNDNDRGYNHFFEQRNDITLTFKVETDPSVGSIHFVLWNLSDPVNPTTAEPATDWTVQNGEVTITIPPHPDFHLGPGPYCATLTASSSTATAATSKSAENIVGNAIYYYDTWKDSRNRSLFGRFELYGEWDGSGDILQLRHSR